MGNLWISAVGLAILSYSLAHIYRILATALHIVDRPNHRSAHSDTTPTGAGVTFVAIFLLAVWLISRTSVPQPDVEMLLALFPALIVITVLGIVDDMRPLPWLVRLCLHLLCAGWVIYIVGFPELDLLNASLNLGVGGLIFGVVALVWLLNLYNFMDGIDGIAISEAVFVLCAALLIGYIIGQPASFPVIALIAACTGFLVINWPKARVFMGDGGSGFLGLVLGALALSQLLVPVWSWLILLGWFIADACLTITIRLIRGEKIHEAHNLHAYQHLNRGIGTLKTLMVVHAVNLLWLAPLAAYTAFNPNHGTILLTLALAPLAAGLFVCGAGQTSPRLMALMPPTNVDKP